MVFTRMDKGTKGEWDLVRRAVVRRESGMAARIKRLLLQLEEQDEGFGIDQLQHSLQTATRALRAGASDEMVVAALCHDVGAVISVENHAGIAAEILRPYVAPQICEIVRTHQEFQRRHYHSSFGRDPHARLRYAWRPWYAEACRFSDEWDQVSFDPDYRTLPLAAFEPTIDRVFERPRPRQTLRLRIAEYWARLRGGAGAGPSEPGSH